MAEKYFFESSVDEFFDDYTVREILESDDEFEIEVESVNEKTGKVIGNAIKLAMMDLKNESSALYTEVFLAFAKFSKSPLDYSRATFASKLVKSIIEPLDYVTGTKKLDAYNSAGQYFSFVVPKHSLEEAFSTTDYDMLIKLPRPGFSLLELGPYALANYALGFYYRYLAEWCGDPDAETARNLKMWKMGPH